MQVRHILPGFGTVSLNPGRCSMSGIVGVAYNLSRKQAAEGWKTEIVGLAAPGAQSRVAVSHRLRVMPVRPHRLLKVGNYDFRYFVPVAAQLLLRHRADIHHVYSNPYLLAVGRAARRVLHYQNQIPVGDVPLTYHRAVQRADAVICCSAFVRDQFLHTISYPSERVWAVPNGVDLDHFRPGDKWASRGGFGIPVDETVVLFAGQVNEEKGLLYLVRALHHLASDYDLRLMVAGSSKLWMDTEKWLRRTQYECTQYERQVAEEARGLKVTFLGKVAYGEMPQVYQAADIFVCPSVWDEPFGMVNLEAMATGLPIVANCVGGIPEVVVDGVTGFLVPPRDVDTLTMAIRKLVEDSLLGQQMGKKGLEHAKKFSWEIITERVREVYGEIGALR